MQRTQRIVRKLIRLTIETGICTSKVYCYYSHFHVFLTSIVVVALINIIIVDLPRDPTKFYEVLLPTVATGILSKIYANTMLVLLNSRAEIVSEALVNDWNRGAEQRVPGEESERTDSQARLRFGSSSYHERS